jgi:hypothetical protein
MFSFWTILRIIFSLLFTLSCMYIIQFINAIEDKKKCSLSEGWRITNGKVVGSILMIVGLVNIFIPANKFLSTLPIIGSSYVLIFMLALFGELFIINRLSINIEESEESKCKIKGFDMLINFFSTKTVIECIYITVIISILFFYL